MDKKNTVIGVLLLAAAFVAMQFAPKSTSPVSPATPAATTPATAAVSTPGATAPSTGGITAPAAVPSTLVATPAAEVPATITTLANDFIEVRFTNSGGAIRDVALKKYPAVQGKPDPFVLNQAHAEPMLAFVDLPGLSRDTAFELISQTATEIVYRAVLDGAIEVTRRYVLPPNEGKNTDPYQLRHETTLRNLSDKPFRAFPASLSLGTAAPANANDNGLQIATGYAHSGDFTFVKRADLEASSGFLGMGKHPEHAFIQSPGPVTWGAVKNRFFAAILTPDAPASSLITRRVKLLTELPDSMPTAYGISGATKFEIPSIAPQAETKLGMNFYVGPKEYSRLAKTAVFKADEDKVMDFGSVFGFFAQLLNITMTWMHNLVASDNASRLHWGVAIILTTLALKLLTLPLTLQASKSMKRMQKLAPEMKIIREKFKDNPQKQQAAMMDLYKQHKVNPLGGCIPMLIPMPFFFGFFTMLQSTAELRFAPFLWAPNLSMPDTVGHVLGFPINILPLILGATMIIQMQLTPTVNMDKAQATMMKFMPVIFMIFCYNFDCALSLYSTVNGLFTIAQQIYINRMKDDGDPTPAINDRLKNVTPKKKKA
ncbi:MAG TPA: membrane protein insertase YidC [Opitutaceae bacterium]|nr:membrane protein insertase YidC [Opitutaceae bacterium]